MKPGSFSNWNGIATTDHLTLELSVPMQQIKYWVVKKPKGIQIKEPRDRNM